MGGRDVEGLAWDWLDHTYADVDRGDDPVDRAYDASEMVDAFHAGHAAGQSKVPSLAVLAISAERARQVEQEGWTLEHDDTHHAGELAAAAAAYAFAAATADRYFALDPLGFWPWEVKWWKPKGSRDNLVRAGALIVAEIERLDRQFFAASSETAT